MKTRKTKCQLRVEALEDRQLLSINVSGRPDYVTALIQNGNTLKISGTDHDDTIVVRRVDNDLTVDGVSGRFSLSVVQRIVVEAGDGNDSVDLSSGGIPASVNGGAGDDTLIGGSGNDTLSGQWGNDYLLGRDSNDQLLGGVDNDTLIGEAGADTLIGSTGNDWLFGYWGNDYLEGDAGRDSLYGGADNDQLYGGDNNDLLEGGTGNDSLWGGDGMDVLRGGAGKDRLWGEVSHDKLFGEAGNDSLYGASGRDSLYGGSGADLLDGGDGNDGLVGGTGNDTVTGGAGADRFLSLKNVVGAFGVGLWDPDYLADIQSEDARINFERGGDHDITMDDITSHFAGANWSDRDLERVDEALAALHERRANTKLLKTSSGGEVTFERYSTGNRSYNFNNSRIALPDIVIEQSDGFVNATVIHEMGHNWDEENPHWNRFLELGTWTQTDPQDDENYVKFDRYGGAWWRRKDAAMASYYAGTDPRDDFAESFAAYFYQRKGWTGYFADGEGAAAIPDKLLLIDAWLSTV